MILDHPSIVTTLGPAEIRRGRRVLILLVGIVLLSAGDLYVTITHARSIGMVELNPIGAYLIEAGSFTGLTLYKVGTLGVAALLLFHIRHHRAGEIGGWVGLVVMSMLAVHWYQYHIVLARELVSVNLAELPHHMGTGRPK